MVNFVTIGTQLNIIRTIVIPIMVIILSRYYLIQVVFQRLYNLYLVQPLLLLLFLLTLLLMLLLLLILLSILYIDIQPSISNTRPMIYNTHSDSFTHLVLLLPAVCVFSSCDRSIFAPLIGSTTSQSFSFRICSSFQGPSSLAVSAVSARLHC